MKGVTAALISVASAGVAVVARNLLVHWLFLDCSSLADDNNFMVIPGDVLCVFKSRFVSCGSGAVFISRRTTASQLCPFTCHSV